LLRRARLFEKLAEPGFSVQQRVAYGMQPKS